VYETIAAQPVIHCAGNSEFNWRAGAATEVFQAIHQKRILRAYTNRIAPALADYFAQRQTPIVTRSLRILEGVEAGALDAAAQQEDHAAMPAVLRFFKLRYAVLHWDLLEQGDRSLYIDWYLKNVMGAREILAMVWLQRTNLMRPHLCQPHARSGSERRINVSWAGVANRTAGGCG